LGRLKSVGKGAGTGYRGLDALLKTEGRSRGRRYGNERRGWGGKKRPKTKGSSDLKFKKQKRGGKPARQI